MIKRDQVANCLLHKRVGFLSEHKVIRNSHRDSLGKDDGVYEKGIEWSQTTHVKVKIYSAIVVKDKVANGIGTLDRICVGVKGR